jgi:Aconitase A
VNKYWDELSVAEQETYPWNAESTYINLPPFFAGFDYKARHSISSIENARMLAVFGDSLSTDHISPAGAIPQDSPAGRYLIAHGVEKKDFNTYGSRRGNHEVMMRGTFANVRIKNLLLNGEEGGYTLHFPTRKESRYTMQQ